MALIAGEVRMSAGQIETGIRPVIVILFHCGTGVMILAPVKCMAGDAVRFEIAVTA